ncbi:MAG: hypothetical protein LIQ31_12325 [Planctomycetes bacterium]|nr:hypothetical protein [Planctomycetota bacterium]
MPDVDYPVNRSDANDPEPDHSEATQDRRATTSIFDDRLTVEKKRHRGENRVPDESRSEMRPEARAGDRAEPQSNFHSSGQADKVSNSHAEYRSDSRAEGRSGTYPLVRMDTRSGAGRNDDVARDDRTGDRRGGSFESRDAEVDRSRDRRYDSIAAAPSEEAVKVSMEARRKMTRAAKRVMDEHRTESPDIRNSINSSFPSEDM